MLLWLFLPLASGWWWEGRDEKMEVEKYKEERRVQQEKEDLDDYLDEYRSNVALERMDLGEYAYYYYEYPEDRQAGVPLIRILLHFKIIFLIKYHRLLLQ